ncbi:Mur ligase [Nocardioides mangrovicus]|uniref:Mur ligase n=1 Tax=Nocardioides mangrovicus TaxID=2478913 RepID=A0A3L8P118_9ACTN|nr:Mur ligase [Nocardioides mangrovicus]
MLEGPNLYFPRAAVKLTLDVSALLGEDAGGLQQRKAARRVEQLVRRIAREAGTSRLGVRVRPTPDPHVLVVAYPWRRRERGRVLGEAVAAVLDGGDEAAAVQRVRDTEPGPGPTTIRPKVPVVAITGTNGKTTTSRMVAHVARQAGKHVGWSSTDGIYVDGELVEAGDYSGPSGAGRVLARPEVEFAVTETARGGILLKGIGVQHNDVSVVTNVTADHLGLQGIDTVDQLAEVKGVVARITKKSGWAVLNADDPRVLAMRTTTPAQPWVFTRDPDSPAVREVLAAGGRATTVIDGWVTVLVPGEEPDPLVRVADVPMTLGGLSRFNVENTLAAASAALGAGLPREAVVTGLRTFQPDVEHNFGRLNMWRLPEGPVVVMDLAHNEAGLEGLLEVLRGLADRSSPPGRVLLGLGAVGDRTDELITNLGEIAAKGADVVAIGHKQRYLRGRVPEEMDVLMRAGAERVGVSGLAAYPTELESLQALVEVARPGDVVGLMCHAERVEVVAWVTGLGGVTYTP